MKKRKAQLIYLNIYCPNAKKYVRVKPNDRYIYWSVFEPGEFCDASVDLILYKCPACGKEHNIDVY